MRNYKLVLEYDGSRYLGWQRLPEAERTVQGKLELTLSRLLNQPVTVNGSGRTDAGVHAKGQVASFLCDTSMSCDELLGELRAHLPEDIGALSLETAPASFHARLSAVKKTYCYRVWNSERPCVFERKYVYTLPCRLDLDAMRQAAGLLCGQHDFRSFCAKRSDKKTAIRTVEAIKIEPIGEELRFTLTADGFLYQMVRILVGTLLEVGMGRREAGSMPYLLDKRSREAAGYTVPAKGLCLMEVCYR